jgi:hypothetical protein
MSCSEATYTNLFPSIWVYISFSMVYASWNLKYSKFQVENYFSDENLPTDEFMLKFVNKNKEGLIGKYTIYQQYWEISLFPGCEICVTYV